jgi:hypothetical protein
MRQLSAKSTQRLIHNTPHATQWTLCKACLITLLQLLCMCCSEVVALLRELKPEATLLVVSHDLADTVALYWHLVTHLLLSHGCELHSLCLQASCYGLETDTRMQHSRLRRFNFTAFLCIAGRL